MRRAILTLVAALTLAALPATPTPAAEAAAGEKLCRIYCEIWYLGCLATGGRISEELCDEWYEGCKEGCRAELTPR